MNYKPSRPKHSFLPTPKLSLSTAKNSVLFFLNFLVKALTINGSSETNSLMFPLFIRLASLATSDSSFS